MAGAIARRLAGWLLAAGIVILPAPASAVAGAAEPAAAVAPPAEAQANPVETLNLYEDGERPGAAERRQSAPVPARSSALSMVARVGFWLGLVIALVCGAVALARKVMPRSAAWGRSQTAELVGRTFLEAKRSVYLLKVGNRVLVVGSAENGLSSLGEITDRAEVDYISCLARGKMTPSPGRKSDFAGMLGGRLSRLVGLSRDGGEQIVDDQDAVADSAAIEREPAGAVGATAARGGVDALREQLARLKRIS